MIKRVRRALQKTKEKYGWRVVARKMVDFIKE